MKIVFDKKSYATTAAILIFLLLLPILSDGNRWLLFFPGVLLVFYLPGSNFNDLILGKWNEKLKWYGKLSLDIATSISVVYLFHAVFKTYLQYDLSKLQNFTLILNLLMLAVGFIGRKKFPSSLDGVHFEKSKTNYIEIAIILVPLLLFFIRYLLNPYVYEIDSQLYIKLYKDLIATGLDNSFLAGLRNGFSLMIAITNADCGLNYIGFFKFFTPILFYLTVPIFYLVCSKIEDRTLRYLSYLSVVIPPIIAIMNEGVRPETFIFVFNFPIFILWYLGIVYKSYRLSLLALMYSLLSFRFHEFGVFLLAISLFQIALVIIARRKELVYFIKTRPTIFAAILIPYLILLLSYKTFILSQVNSGIFATTMLMLQKSLSNFHWDWWFINSYTAIDSGKIGWPGYTFIFYYLYNGIILAIALLVLCLLFTRYYKKTKSNIFPLIPVIFYSVFYIAIAEILPRIGIFLLPNRAWPHLMLALIFLTPFIINRLESTKLKKTIVIIMIFAILSGVLGSIIGSTFMGAMVSPQESGVIKTISGLPSNSLIVSTQPNDNLVIIHGNKDFLGLNKSVLTTENFDDEIKSSINLALGEKKQQTIESIVISTSQENIVKENGIVISRQIVSSQGISDSNQKLELLKTYDPSRYYDLVNQLEADNSFNGIKAPIYLLYSFAKFDGILAQRQWWKDNNDISNYDFFKNYTTRENVVYKDKDTILIKIK